MKPLRAVVADDEAPARAKVVRLLEKDGRFTVAGEAVDGRDAVAKVEALKPDLLLLDIQMPALTGFEVLQALGPAACPKVVFSTAHDEFALQAFEANAIDYLLKPYDAARFSRAMDKAAAQLEAGATDGRALTALLKSHPAAAGPHLERLLVKRKGSWVPVPLSTVRRLTSEDKYVRAYSAGGEDLLRETLSELEPRLDPKVFVRVHRGEIVNLAFVAKMDTLFHGDAVVTLLDGSTVAVSRKHKDAFFAAWGGS